MGSWSATQQTGRGVAGIQKDKAPVEWPRSEDGADPAERLVSGRLLWKPTPERGPLNSHTGQCDYGEWRRERSNQGDEGLGK